MLNEIIKKEDGNTDCIYLYKQGCFLRAYNQSAMHFVLHIAEYKIHIRFIKKLNRKIYYLGFPISNWVKVAQFCSKNNFHISEAGNIICIHLNKVKMQDFAKWAKNQDAKLNTDRLGKFDLEQAIQNFSVGNSNAVEALNFISELQGRLKLKTGPKSHG